MRPDDTCSPLTDLLDKLEYVAIAYGHECPDPDDLRQIGETKEAIVNLFASVGAALEIARDALSEAISTRDEALADAAKWHSAWNVKHVEWQGAKELRNQYKRERDELGVYAEAVQEAWAHFRTDLQDVAKPGLVLGDAGTYQINGPKWHAMMRRMALAVAGKPSPEIGILPPCPCEVTGLNCTTAKACGANGACLLAKTSPAVVRQCEHNFPADGCEICNRFPTLEAWVKSPECEAICERRDGAYSDLIEATWNACAAGRDQRIERLEQSVRVERKVASLGLSQDSAEKVKP